MTAPPRIMDDPNVSSALRSDLSRAAESSVGSYDAAQGLTALREAIKADGGSSPASGGSLGARPLFKIVGGVGALLGAGVLAALLWPDASPAPSRGASNTPLQAGPAEDEPSHEEPLREATSGPALSGDEDAAAVPALVEPSDVSPETRATSNKHSAAVLHVQTDPDEVMRQEISHLKKVRAALATNAAQALTLTQEGHQRFAQGILYEEREGLAILALQKLGRIPEATGRARRFAARFPKSPLLAQMGPLLAADTP